MDIMREMGEALGPEKMAEIGKQIRQQMKSQQMERVYRLRRLNEHVVKGETLFTGSSLMEQFPIDEILMTEGIHKIIYNRGVGGFTTADMLQNMEEMVFATEPSVIFINIGTNDMNGEDFTLEGLIANYREILRQIQERLPGVKIYTMAYYPINDQLPDVSEMQKKAFESRTLERIARCNQAVEELAEEMGCTYIDVNDGLTDETGRMKAEYAIEGIHMYANGYRVVFENMKPYLGL